MAFRFFYRFLIIFTHWAETTIKQTSLQQWEHAELVASASSVLLWAGSASAGSAVMVGEIAPSSTEHGWCSKPGSSNLHTTKWNNWPRPHPSSAAALGVGFAAGRRGSLQQNWWMMGELWHQVHALYQGNSKSQDHTHGEMLGSST